MGRPMVQAQLKPSRRTRLGVAAMVAGGHVLAIVALVQAFAPQIGSTVLQQATSAFDVVMTTPEPPPPPPQPDASPSAAREPEGAAAPAGKRAQPREVAAPAPKVVVSRDPAPVIAGKGSADSVGASDSGAGTGAGGVGSGTGAGSRGSGPGGGGDAARAVKLSGDIVSARDYPRSTRAARLGSAVTVALTVGTDGRVRECRVLRPSADPEADRITCRLATERFRFRPARNAAGEPIESVYGWQQRWFTPDAP